MELHSTESVGDAKDDLVVAENREGRFYVSSDLLRIAGRRVAELVFSKVVIVEVYLFSPDLYCYRGFSLLFDPIPGVRCRDLPPEYNVTISEQGEVMAKRHDYES